MLRIVDYTENAARRVATRWKEQYYDRSSVRWSGTIDGSARRVYVALQRLPATAPLDEIDTIIGNDTWTHETCTECGESVAKFVQVGDDTIVCFPCARGWQKVLNAVL